MSLALPSTQRDTRTRDTKAYENPMGPARFGLLVVAGFVGAFLIWGAFAPLSGAAIAEGSLQAEGRRRSVQHPYGGVVQKIDVREGDRVSEGQVVMTLSDTDPRAKLDVLKAEWSALKAEEARLIAERDEKAEPAFDPAITGGSLSQAVGNEIAIMRARARQHETSLGMLRQKRAQLGEQINGIRSQIAGLDRQRALLTDEMESVKKLLDQGLAPRTRMLTLERDFARIESEGGAKAADLARAQEAVGETELEITKQERTRITEITDQLRTVQSRLAELQPKLDAAADVLARTRVTAPATGSVVSLSVFTEGGVIQPGARLLDIVPDGSPLIVEARLHLSDVGEVKPGQPADVRLTGFTRSERPQIMGEVMTVSADSLTDERSGSGYYSIQVRLNPDDVRNAKVRLHSGMPAQVVMETRPRTLADYLVSPLLDEVSGAFRER
ncbi:HlyD family type I secretion periplasmic adaptor subunit [Xanthobacteraceae bacterium A53D]